MYNFITNDWKDAPHQMTFDVRQPKTKVYVKEKLKRWCEENPQVDVVRFATFRVPSKEFRDFIEFQQIEVSKLAKELVDIIHSYGKEVMMLLGDYWIGTEPYGKYFETIGLDAVVGSVGDGVTMRMISDIKGVNYTEGRLLPYFFPDVFSQGVTPLERLRIIG